MATRIERWEKEIAKIKRIWIVQSENGAIFAASTDWDKAVAELNRLSDVYDATFMIVAMEDLADM